MPPRFFPALLALFASSAAAQAAGSFTVSTLTGDANSGIAADSSYTHAIDVFDTANAKINGAVFTGSGAGANPSTNNYTTSGFNNGFNGFDALANDGISGGVGGMMTNFLYNGNPAQVTLKNLRVGEQYEMVFYNGAFGGPGVRFQTISLPSEGGSILFDQNGIPGSLLKCAFIPVATSVIFNISPSIPGNTFHQYAFSNRASRLQALLTDNFYAPANPDTTDLNFNLAARQGGSLVQASGPISWVGVGNAQVGNNTGGVDAGNYLLTASGTGIAALDHNFNGAETLGGLSIAFDLAPDFTAAGAGNFCAINLGQSSADKHGSVDGAQTHFGVRVRGSTGTLQAFDGSTLLTAVEPSWGSTNVTTQLHHFEILITDPVDLNPFDGVNETRVEIFADGVSRYVFTKTGGGYANNFLNFQSSQVGAIDNLVISKLNAIPAAPVFTTEPVSQTLWVGDVLTLTAAATGYPPAISYQWKKNGANIIINGTSATYTLADATNAAGVYTVVATNSSGSKTSLPVSVTVIAPTRAQRTWEGAGASSRRTGLAISEIHYHPPTRMDGRNLEFVELYNSNPWIEDLAGWRLTGDVEFTFPAGTQIAAKGYLVVAKVPADVQSVYGLSGVMGGFSQNLSNQGGTLRLRKPSNAIVLEVTWNDQPPWPVAADGTGHSLVLARPSFGEASDRAWGASASLGGSPGVGDAPPGSPQDHVAINEVLTRSLLPTLDYIELRNDGRNAADISGCTLSDDLAMLGKFVIPAATSLAAGATISFSETQLGFALSAEGETIYFTNAAGTRVLDCVRFGGSAENVSLGRANNRDGPLRPLASSTPGTTNSGLRVPDVLISEIFFDPISGDDLDEWLELYNPGVADLDLGGWKFVDGINFTMPPGTIISSGGRLVVAKNAVRTRANHPALNPALVVGDYSGTLGNSGDRLTIVRPELDGVVPVDVEVDTLAYAESGRRSRWAEGGGSSLEVTDLHADRGLANAWADSDESAKAPWTTVSTNGTLDLGHAGLPTGANRVQFFLMGEGETLTDDVAVMPNGVGSALTNGGFESGITGWTVQGNQSRSSVVAGAGVTGAALKLRASSSGDPDGNRVFASLTSTLAPNTTATVSAKARWQRGSPEMILRLNGGYLETLTKLTVPTNLGTPGAANSQAVTNAGPAITEVFHRPILPPINTKVRVFARVNDPDGVTAVTLRWRLESNPTFLSATMRDDGTNGDIFSGDGVYTGSIPSQSSPSTVAFKVEATDTFSPAASAVFPPDAPTHECLVRIGDPPQDGDFTAYRLWVTSANVTAWSNRARFGNEPIDATFLYGGVRAVYGCGAWYSGSEASTPGFNSPLGTLCGYNLILPDDDLVMAEDHFTLDFPVRDVTDQREQLMFWMAEQLHLPNLHRRYVHLFFNGTRRSVIYDDVQQPDQTLLNEFYPGDSDGHLYKTNNWTEGLDDGNNTHGSVSNLLQHYDSAGQHKLARYRWNWRPRAANSANEFGDIFTLIDAANATSNYQATVESVVDVENWMRTFAFHDLCSYWDAFGNPNTKNTYIYKPQAGRWVQFTWDMDVGLGVFVDPVDAELFPATIDPKIDALQVTPAFRRIYWQAMHEALATFFSSAGVNTQLQRKYDALAANNLGLTSPFVPSGAYGLSIPQWIDQRRAFLQTQLNTVAANFAILSPPNVTVTTPVLTINGTAPVNVEKLLVNGIEYPVVWSSVTAWSITLVPAAGTHPYVVEAFDYNDVQVGTGTVTVNFTGVNAWPALRINEWMASNQGSVLDPSDGKSDDWLEIFNPTATTTNLAGWRLSDTNPSPTVFIFPAGYSLTGGGRLVAWCDDETIQSAAPTSLHLPFKLSASGETLTLSAPDGTVIDTVTFMSQVANISQGRIPDGGPAIDFLKVPSAGTANSAAIDLPVATATAVNPDLIDITVNSTPGFNYQLQVNDQLAIGDWENFGAAITATGNSYTFQDATSLGSKRFYRVVRTP